MPKTSKRQAPNTQSKIGTTTRKAPELKAKPRSKGQKSIAKIGMAGSLSTVLVSGFFKFHGAKFLHVYSGLGLLAFTIWHYLQNQPKSKSQS